MARSLQSMCPCGLFFAMTLPEPWALYSGHINGCTLTRYSQLARRLRKASLEEQRDLRSAFTSTPSTNPQRKGCPGTRATSLEPPQTATKAQTDRGLQEFFFFLFFLHITQCPIHTTEPRPPLSPRPVCSQDQLSSFPHSHAILFWHQYAEATRQEGCHEAGLRGQRSPQPRAGQHLLLVSPTALCTTLAPHGTATLPPAQHLPMEQLPCSEGYKIFHASANNPNTNDCNFYAASP